MRPTDAPSSPDAAIRPRQPALQSASANYVDDAAIAAYFAMREHYAYYRSLKFAKERRDLHEKLIPVLRQFLEDATERSWGVLDAIIARGVGGSAPQVVQDPLALPRRQEPEGFRLLDLEARIDFDGLRQAYRRAAFRYHPDRGGSNDQMVAINSAYDLAHAALCAQLGVAPDMQGEIGSRGVQMRRTLDYLWFTTFCLFTISVDDWSLDEASELLTRLCSDTFRDSIYAQADERWIELTRPVADLVKRQVAAGNRFAAEQALRMVRVGAKRSGLLYGSIVESAENAFSGKKRTAIRLNHIRQVENAFRYGAIDEKSYAAARERLARQRAEQQAEAKRLEMLLQTVTFTSRLPVDPSAPASRASTLVPSPGYSQVRTVDLSSYQLAEYQDAFGTRSSLELITKYVYVRLSSLLRSPIYYPGDVDPQALADEARTLIRFVPRCEFYARQIAVILELFARMPTELRREYAAKLEVIPGTIQTFGDVDTVWEPANAGGLDRSFLEKAYQAGQHILARTLSSPVSEDPSIRGSKGSNEPPDDSGA